MDASEQKAARTVWNSERTVRNSREVTLAASFEHQFDRHKVDDERTSSFINAWEKEAVRTVWNSKPHNGELDDSTIL